MKLSLILNVNRELRMYLIVIGSLFRTKLDNFLKKNCDFQKVVI